MRAPRRGPGFSRACDGQCQACGEAATKGACVTVAGAPRAGRAACAGTGVCQGTCDGASATACAFPDAATSCAAASCESGQAIEAASCDAATLALFNKDLILRARRSRGAEAEAEAEASEAEA